MQMRRRDFNGASAGHAFLVPRDKPGDGGPQPPFVMAGLVPAIQMRGANFG